MDTLELIKTEIQKNEEQMKAMKTLPFSTGKVLALAELGSKNASLRLRAAAYQSVVKTTKINQN